VSRFGFVLKRKKLVYLMVVITLLLHSCGDITAVFNGLSILTLFDWLANNVSFSSASFLGFLEVVCDVRVVQGALFLGHESTTYCMGCVGSTGLVVCCKPRGEQQETCGTKHNGAPFELPEGRLIKDLVFVHDP
jgi:hypothetical protein